MECPKCKLQFDTRLRIPLLLPQCGHTLCQSCVEKVLSEGRIICSECGKPSSGILSPSALPRNIVLLQLAAPKDQAQAGTTATAEEICCSVHGKKLEAFCEDDMRLLCIDCILVDGHKAHEICPIPSSSERERGRVRQGLGTAKKVEADLTLLLSNMEKYETKMGETAGQRQGKVAEVFAEIVKTIRDYEEGLKSGISRMLQKERDQLNETRESIRLQMKAIQEFQLDVGNVSNESDCELLQRSATRREKSQRAGKAPPTVLLALSFPEVVKDKELANVWKVFFPNLCTSAAVAYRPASSMLHYARRVPGAQRNCVSRGSTRPKERAGLTRSSITNQTVSSSRAESCVLSPRRSGSKPQPADTAKLFSSNFQVPANRSRRHLIKENPTTVSSMSRERETRSVARPSAVVSTPASTKHQHESFLLGQKPKLSRECSSGKLPVPIPVSAISIELEKAEGEPKRKPSADERPDSADRLQTKEGEAQKPNTTTSNLRDRKAGNMAPNRASGSLKRPSTSASGYARAILMAAKSSRPGKVSPAFSRPSISSRGRSSVAPQKAATYIRKESPEDSEELDVPEPSERVQKVKKSPAKSTIQSRVNVAVKVEQKPQDTEWDEEESEPARPGQASVTNSLFEAYVNGVGNNGVSFSSLLERGSQYVYVFCTSPVLIQLAGYGENALTACERYEVDKGIWRELRPISQPRSKFSAVVTLSGHMLLLGGKLANGARTDRVEEYDPEKDRWAEFGGYRMAKPRSSFSAVQAESMCVRYDF